MWTKITPNTDTFHAVKIAILVKLLLLHIILGQVTSIFMLQFISLFVCIFERHAFHTKMVLCQISLISLGTGVSVVAGR